MSAAPIYIPQRFSKSAPLSRDLRDTLIGGALGVVLAGAVFGLAELAHHTGHNPFLAEEPAAASEVA